MPCSLTFKYSLIYKYSQTLAIGCNLEGVKYSTQWVSHWNGQRPSLNWPWATSSQYQIESLSKVCFLLQYRPPEIELTNRYIVKNNSYFTIAFLAVHVKHICFVHWQKISNKVFVVFRTYSRRLDSFINRFYTKITSIGFIIAPTIFTNTSKKFKLTMLECYAKSEII